VLTPLSNAEVLELLMDPDYGSDLGLLITGGSPDERSTMAESILSHRRAAGQSCQSLTVFEVVAANHFGQGDRLRRDDVLLINELGELSHAEQVAIGVINPIFDVTWTLGHILRARCANECTTVVTTKHDLSELEALFGDRVADELRYLDFSITLDGEDRELHADQS
jgi:hypothetical protein